MNAKDKAKELVDKFKIVLMSEDTDCGNEILCTLIAIEHSKIVVQNVISANPHSNPFNSEPHSTIDYWLDVLKQLNNL